MDSKHVEVFELCRRVELLIKFRKSPDLHDLFKQHYLLELLRIRNRLVELKKEL